MHREPLLSEVQITAMDSVFFIVLLPYINRDLRSCFPPVLSKSFSVLITDPFVLNSSQSTTRFHNNICSAIHSSAVLYLASRQYGTNPLETSDSASSGFGTAFGHPQTRPRQRRSVPMPRSPNSKSKRLDPSSSLATTWMQIVQLL
jgi:hypothetical protein